MKDTERGLHTQINTLNNQMSLKDSELVRMTGKLENMYIYSQTIEKEVKEWRQRVEGLNSEIH